VVQAVNTTFRISDREGTTLLTIPMFDFFGLSQIPNYDAEVFDPRVIYDSVHGRWIAIEASFDCYPFEDSEVGTGYVDVAVSETADPLGTWTVSSIPYPDAVPDYPGIGTSTDKVVIGTNVFPLVAGSGLNGCDADGTDFLGTELDVLAWSELKGPDLPTVTYLVGGTDFDNDYFTWRPALATPTTSATVHVIGQSAVDGSVAYTRITGNAAAGGTITLASITDLSFEGVAAPFALPPAPAQPGSPATIERAVDQRPTDAVWQGGRLAFVSTYPCDPAGGATETRDCVRVTELSTTSTTPSRLQDFLVAEDGADHYMGGVGYARNGDLHLAWTRSSATAGQYPSSYVAHQPADAAADTMSDPVLLEAGTGTYPGIRWGDYVGVAQDPQVPNAVWSANQVSAGASFWSTRVSQLQTGGATYVQIPPVRVLDSRNGTGLSGAFTSSVPRDFIVAGFSDGTVSIPADALAVTGNVTVTGQTGAGYVSITTTPTATPGTSTINFPLGDTRANNVTVPLAASGRLAAVYKAGSGRTAHVLFDVTGYFVAGDDEAGYTPIDPVRALDSRPGISVGLVGPFQANVPRALPIAGEVPGIPADAVAITANLTVTGQTRAGYASITPTSEANPATSTVNFPVGDNRANGLTATLSGGGVWLVYKATTGSTAHLILDITGYYLPAGEGLSFYPLDPGRIMDTRTSILSGLTGLFTASVPRGLDTDGHWGVPAGAQAVTGNLTVTGQTRGGYVSATPTSVVDPTTSTMNFPVGDSRANGITVPLGPSGDQYFVYKASSGAKTHLILDVTGYFR
jgi:hypothetical protein